jgi:SAM-dependent methyltransferase
MDLDLSAIRDSVKKRFDALARDPASEQRFPVGPDSARRLGYTDAELAGLPVSAVASFAGVGHPLALSRPAAGQTVLDLGCGAGVDSLLAARLVGPGGRVIGIDMTAAMVARARAGAAEMGLANVEFRVGDVEALPVDSASIDLVISNGVFNLCINKPAVLAEVFRVLRPGGRLQMADILLEPDVTPEELAGKGEWSD